MEAISCSNDDSEIEILMSQFIIHKRSLSLRSAEASGITISHKMSVPEATQLMSLLRLSNNKMRDLRKILSNTNVGNFLPSEPKIRQNQKRLTAHLDIDKVETGRVLLQHKRNDTEFLTEKAYVRVKILLSFVNHIVANTETYRDDKEFNNTI